MHFINTFITTGIFFSVALFASESLPVLIQVPGLLNGGNSALALKRKVFTTRVPQYHDLGQKNTQECITQSLTTIPNNRRRIGHGASQGGMGLINYASKNHGSFDVLIVEAAGASGNSAIMRTLETQVSRYCTWLPFINFWLPDVARIFSPIGKMIDSRAPNLMLYQPAGEQPIFSISHIQPEVPIILIHNPLDKLLPYNDTQALYYAARNRGNGTGVAFFISVPENCGDSEQHVSLLDEDDEQPNTTKEQVNAIKTFIKKIVDNKLHPLSPEEKKEYQPDYQAYKNTYDNLVKKEQRFASIRKLIPFGLGGFFALLYYLVKMR